MWNLRFVGNLNLKKNYRWNCNRFSRKCIMWYFLKIRTHRKKKIVTIVLKNIFLKTVCFCHPLMAWFRKNSIISQMPIVKLLNLPVFIMSFNHYLNFKPESRVCIIDKCMSTVIYNNMRLMHWMCWNFFLALLLTKRQNVVRSKLYLGQGIQ